jgi:hypothetical protein
MKEPPEGDDNSSTAQRAISKIRRWGCHGQEGFLIKPITQEALREIVPDFAKAIREKKAKNVKPAKAVINFRDEKI